MVNPSASSLLLLSVGVAGIRAVQFVIVVVQDIAAGMGQQCTHGRQHRTDLGHTDAIVQNATEANQHGHQGHRQKRWSGRIQIGEGVAGRKRRR